MPLCVGRDPLTPQPPSLLYAQNPFWGEGEQVPVGLIIERPYASRFAHYRTTESLRLAAPRGVRMLTW